MHSNRTESRSLARRGRGSRAAIASASLAVAALALAPAASALPIPDVGLPSLPAFQGSPATAKKIKPRSKPEQNPYMAEDPNSNIHNDSWMTDAYNRRGPLGNSPVTTSEGKPPSLCGSLTFDSRGRIVTVCPSIVAPPVARIIDPESLETIAEFTLPNAPTPAGTPEFQNFAGGGYFFLDHKDRMWVPTKTDHLYVLGQSDDGSSFELRRDYDLTSVLDTSTERITSALPDFKGRIWLVTKANGKILTLDRKTGEVKVKRLDEEIQNSFAVASDGVYIVSDRRMYRFKANDKGRPRMVWSAGYRNSGIVKPGQVNAGSGTTPTVMPGGMVAITDNADPMNVVVYRTERKLDRGDKRKVCTQPVFEPGASATENTLIGINRSLLVENNYGYRDPFGPEAGTLTEPGVARVDVRKNGKGCKLKWTNDEVRIPSVVPKLSTKTGLMYAYSRPEDPGVEGYYWTAIDYRTGETRWMQYAGSGLPYNNSYAGLALGPDGSAYLGVTGGIIRLRDGG
jgi:hypothetical protein